MGNKKKGKNTKKAKVGLPQQGTGDEEGYKKAPHTFVFNRGNVGKNVGSLIRDMRRVMEPYTASKLKVRKKNVLKDFVSIAGVLNVSHLVMFSKTETSTNMRVARLPRGPTLTFKVDNYCLAKDVITSLRRHNMEQKQFQHHPLLVMNNLSGEGLQLKLMATMFQNMFPSININKVKLNDIRRCVLLNYKPESKTLEFRHYNVRAMPVGMSKSVKKLVKAKIPNLGKYEDVSEYMLQPGHLSESEAEMDGPHNEVVLPQQMSTRGNIKASKSAIRLTEIGPRLSLKLIKIEEGVCGGEVMFHQFVTKTEEEVVAMKAAREKKRKMKLARKQQQEANLKKKEAKKDELKQKSIDGMKRKNKAEGEEEDDMEVEQPTSTGNVDGGSESEEDDDIEYYKKEVGEAPDPELGLKRRGSGLKRKRKDQPHLPYKKKRQESQDRQQTGKYKGSGRMSDGKKPFDRNKQSKFGDRKQQGKKFGDKKFGDRKSGPNKRNDKKVFGNKKNVMGGKGSGDRKKYVNKNKKGKGKHGRR